MHHSTPLLATLVGGLVLAFLLGMIANRLRISPIVGYLAAGVIAGPFTPGFVADASIAPELAEIGVILLMFGVGLHFSLKDLLAVKKIAIPGAIAQISLATLLGMGLSHLLGWSLVSGLVFGLSLSTASTVVLLRSLEERQLIDTRRGQIAIGWLIVEDLAMVLTLVLLPALAGLLKQENTDLNTLLIGLGITLGKVILFILLMVIVGRRVIPWLLAKSAATGSRELFTLSVLALSLGIAYGAVHIFDVSFALGAFFAGMVLNESEFSHRAAHDTMPLRDAFAVLFFVSVGMLLDPHILWQQPLAVLGTVLIIIIGKSIAAYLLVKLFGYSNRTAFTISASLAQIGEFAFILAGLGITLGLFTQQGQGLVLAGAIISIMLNPVLFGLLERYLAVQTVPDKQAEDQAELTESLVPETLSDHALIVGYDEVGRHLVEQLHQDNIPLVVIDTSHSGAESLWERGIPAVVGNAAHPEILALGHLDRARWLILITPNGYESGEIAAHVRQQLPDLQIIACVTYPDEMEYLLQHGANHVILGEQQIANSIASHLSSTLPLTAS